MGVLKSIGAEEILKRGSIRDADVQRLRQAYYEDATISPDEAEKLFAINEACPVQDPSWAQFFVEAITDYVVNQAQPEGYLTADNASWLIEHIAKDGNVETKTELDLLVTVLDKARWSPASLVSFALGQVKRAVIDGLGPLRAGQSPVKGTISESEVELLRRILYAFGGGSNVAITRAEAEILFEINNAVADGPINPAWTDLFVKAIANVLMATSGYGVPSREEALRAEAWLESRGDLSPAALVSAMVASSFGSVKDAYHEQSSEDQALARLERQRIEIITNEEITEGEAQWLAEHLSGDGKLSATEQALMAYLKRESPKIHPLLNELIAGNGKAA
jgi:hypothetical protein